MVPAGITVKMPDASFKYLASDGSWTSDVATARRFGAGDGVARRTLNALRRDGTWKGQRAYTLNMTVSG